MVDEYRTDDEQIEAIKNWWDENGRSTLIMIALAVAAVFGWNQWQSSKQQANESASMLYQQILDSMPQQGQQVEQTAAQKATVVHLATQLKTEHDGSTYAHFAALHMAKLEVENDDLPAAREQLQWVLDNDPSDPALTSLARLRLARVVFSEEGAEQALALIDNVETGPYRADYAELRGDMYEDLGQLDQAEQQYGLAKEASGGVAGQTNPLLELKYQSVARRLPKTGAVDAVSASETVEATVEEAASTVSTTINEVVE